MLSVHHDEPYFVDFMPNPNPNREAADEAPKIYKQLYDLAERLKAM